MPRPSKSGYARLRETEEEEEEEEEQYQDNVDENTAQSSRPRISSESYFAPIQPGRHDRMQVNSSPAKPSAPERRPSGHRRARSGSAVDIRAINARLERWAEEIAQKFKIKKIKGKSEEEEKLEIHYSVFQAPDDIRHATVEELAERFSKQDLMTKQQFDDVIESVKIAQEQGIQPKLVAQGSSGSYFAKNSQGITVGIFKPKDEEPYATKNPKWTKWIHRNLFPFFFGRACLIPNLSYVSEAAAYVLDCRLMTNLVPYTDVVYLSSPSFNYDFWDRRAFYRKKKPLPSKPGSFQVFLKGFKDASAFLKQHPWPDQTSTNFTTPADRSRRTRWADDCRLGSAESDDEDGDEEQRVGWAEADRRKQFWSPALQKSFREELDKLVILDYIMRNTDRGLDNWMIRIDQDSEQATIVADVPKKEKTDEPYAARKDSMTASTNDSSSGSRTPQEKATPKVMLGAIDNSLAWPWKHPDAWRSFPFGWLFLPVSLIGQPFSQKTREHFLPILTSKQWWSDTQVALRECFSQDDAFNEKMFARQIAVMKGQAWNVVETLKDKAGPLELTRRTRVCVWDDLQDIPYALPLRESSDEMRRQYEREAVKKMHEREELDIGASRQVAPDLAKSLLQLSPPPGEGIGASRFNMPRETSREDDLADGGKMNGNENGANEDLSSEQSRSQSQGQTPGAASPRRPSHRPRFSYDVPRRPWHTDSRKRNYSFTAKPWQNEEEEDQGDLGYAAMQDMENQTKKVIVERLETVKSKAPVFTWC